LDAPCDAEEWFAQSSNDAFAKLDMYPVRTPLVLTDQQRSGRGSCFDGRDTSLVSSSERNVSFRYVVVERRNVSVDAQMRISEVDGTSVGH